LSAETETQTGERIDEIDGLRAFAMTAVVAEHCRILPFGWMGVWLFFVISGFVVTTSLVSRPTTAPQRLLGRFYARRAARILPIYLAYVLIGFLVSAATVHRAEWAPLASLLLFYNNFQSAFSVGVFRGFPVGHLWTISVEMQFYLVFGLAFALLPRRCLVGVLFAMLVGAPLLRFLGGEALARAGFSPLRASFAIYSFSLMHFDAFALGSLLALGAAHWRRPPRSVVLLAIGVVAMAVYVTVYVAINRSHHLDGLAMFRRVVSGIVFAPDDRQVWLYSAVILLSTGVLATTLGGRAPWAAITGHRFIQAVGKASYGGYVYHAFFVWLLRGQFHSLWRPAGMIGKLEFGVVLFALALPATIAASLASYRWIEKPIMAWASRHLGERPSGGRAVTAAAST
jgi:peptidoglycan/LPS O-acetylase OafA/YrhL